MLSSRTVAHRCARRAFSLVELMVVVVIIGILATAVALRVSDYLVTAKQNRARQDLATIRDALELWNTETHRYPTNDEGLEALTKKTPSHPRGVLSALPVDPWGRPYLYLYPGPSGGVEVYTLGRDGVQGGDGEDSDLSSSDLQGPAGSATKKANP